MKRNEHEVYLEKLSKRIDSEIQEIKEVNIEKKKNLFGKIIESVPLESYEKLMQQNQILKKANETLEERLDIKTKKLDLMNSKRYVDENKALKEQNQEGLQAIHNLTQKNKILSQQLETLDSKNKEFEKTINELKQTIQDRDELIKDLELRISEYQDLDEEDPFFGDEEERESGYMSGEMMMQTKRFRQYAEAEAARNNPPQMERPSRHFSGINGTRTSQVQRPFRSNPSKLKKEISDLKETIFIKIISKGRNIFQSPILELCILQGDGVVLFHEHFDEKNTINQHRNVINAIIEKYTRVVGFGLQRELEYLFANQIGFKSKTLIDARLLYQEHLRKKSGSNIRIFATPQEIALTLNPKFVMNHLDLKLTVQCMIDIYKTVFNETDNPEDFSKMGLMDDYEIIIHQLNENMQQGMLNSSSEV